MISYQTQGLAKNRGRLMIGEAHLPDSRQATAYRPFMQWRSRLKNCQKVYITRTVALGRGPISENPILGAG